MLSQGQETAVLRAPSWPNLGKKCHRFGAIHQEEALRRHRPVHSCFCGCCGSLRPSDSSSRSLGTPSYRPTCGPQCDLLAGYRCPGA